jgi:hypothetical protein
MLVSHSAELGFRRPPSGWKQYNTDVNVDIEKDAVKSEEPAGKAMSIRDQACGPFPR